LSSEKIRRLASNALSVWVVAYEIQICIESDRVKNAGRYTEKGFYQNVKKAIVGIWVFIFGIGIRREITSQFFFFDHRSG